jgi:hypothetical protein
MDGKEVCKKVGKDVGTTESAACDKLAAKNTERINANNTIEKKIRRSLLNGICIKFLFKNH